MRGGVRADAALRKLPPLPLPFFGEPLPLLACVGRCGAANDAAVTVTWPPPPAPDAVDAAEERRRRRCGGGGGNASSYAPPPFALKLMLPMWSKGVGVKGVSFVGGAAGGASPAKWTCGFRERRFWGVDGDDGDCAPAAALTEWFTFMSVGVAVAVDAGDAVSSVEWQLPMVMTRNVPGVLMDCLSEAIVSPALCGDLVMIETGRRVGGRRPVEGYRALRTGSRRPTSSVRTTLPDVCIAGFTAWTTHPVCNRKCHCGSQPVPTSASASAYVF